MALLLTIWFIFSNSMETASVSSNASRSVLEFLQARLRHVSWPALLGVLTALCDETIQLFYAGRGSRVTDVWIDFAGVVTGILAAQALAAAARALLPRRRRSEPPRH